MTELEQLKKENQALNNLIEVLNHENEYNLKTQLNVISKNLKVEYQDFMSIANLPDNEMTLDLGNNLKCQLNNIFKILKKQGIKF